MLESLLGIFIGLKENITKQFISSTHIKNKQIINNNNNNNSQCCVQGHVSFNSVGTME
jgi:hypothetical protein